MEAWIKRFIAKLRGSITSRTQWFAVAIGALGWVQANTELLTQILGEGRTGTLLYLAAGGIAFFRWITSKALDAPK